MICAHCGAPVRWVHKAGGWLHTAALGEFRISRREADDIHRDPPRGGEPLHRQTLIHPAEPPTKARWVQTRVGIMLEEVS